MKDLNKRSHFNINFIQFLLLYNDPVLSMKVFRALTKQKVFVHFSNDIYGGNLINDLQKQSRAVQQEFIVYLSAAIKKKHCTDCNRVIR